MTVQIQLRNGTAAQWTSANPVLAAGEAGVETDTSKFKIGNGSTAWASLAYSSGTTGSNPVFNTAVTVTTLSAGSSATSSISNTVPLVPVLSIGVPIGATGATGDTGSTGATGATGAAGEVTFVGVQTLTNKTLTGVKEVKVAMAALAIDLSLGNYFSKTISGASTLTISNVAAADSVSSFILDVTNGASGAITWFTGIKWAAGTAPTLSTAGRDCLGFFTHDGGTTWNGFLLGKAMA